MKKVSHSAPLQSTPSYAPVVLVAESNPSNGASIASLLANLGFASETVGSGKDVLLAMKGRSYAAVILDCQLPDLGGFQTCKQIRKDLNKTVPVIGLTANDIPGGDEKARAAGMNGFLEKPLAQDQLERALGEWIGDPISRFLAQQKLRAEQRLREEADAEKDARMKRIANSIAQDEQEAEPPGEQKETRDDKSESLPLLAPHFNTKGR